MKPENYKKRLLTYSVLKLKKIADEVCSLYIRTKFADWKGEVQCYTCPVKKPIKEMQNGHYISRVYMNTRYYEPNLRPQCYRCNVLLKGNYTEFSINLLRESPTSLEELARWKVMKSKDSTRYDLLDIIESFKTKLQKLDNNNIKV